MSAPMTLALLLFARTAALCQAAKAGEDVGSALANAFALLRLLDHPCRNG
jgi:hypothetical protein